MVMKRRRTDLIIVTHNSEEYIENCLASVEKAKDSFSKVIILDNASSDGTLDTLNLYEGKFLIVRSKDNLGYAKGVNKAVDLSRSEYVVILNPDTTVTKNFANLLISELNKDKSVAAAQPSVFILRDKKRINLTGKITHYLGFDWIRGYKEKVLPKKGEIVSFSGSAVAVRKSVFEELGGYDEFYFMYYEDSDLSWRMQLMGYKILFVPSSKVYHDYKYKPKEAYQPLKKKLYYAERNRLVTLFKNYSGKTLVLLSPAIFLIEAMMVIFSIINGWFIQKIKGYADIFTNRSLIKRQRVKIQGERKQGDRQIFGKFARTLSFSHFQIAPVRFIVNPFLFSYYRLIKPFI